MLFIDFLAKTIKKILALNFTRLINPYYLQKRKLDRKNKTQQLSKTMRILVCSLLLVCFQTAFGQVPPYWTLMSSEQNKGSTISSESYFQLNHESLQKRLIKAPTKGIAKDSPTKTFLSFPTPDGQFQEFLIEETSNFHPDLAAAFPLIKTYKGRNTANPTNTIRFSINPNGISAMIQTGNGPPVFIDKKNKTPDQIYQVYFKKAKAATPFACKVLEMANKELTNNENSRNHGADCQLRTFRLALACTGEYAEYHGGNTADVLAAMNETLTIINGIFERDLAVRLELIPETTALIFLDKDSDPYTNTELATMLGENQMECDTKIGVDNYDIGHVFGTGSGGVAFLGVVCEQGFKASGATGFFRPEGPTFAIDLVAHEIGHQFGAQHTFNGDQVACAGSNRSSETSVEPGSGSTIMSYAGICPPQNVQGNSDEYFHAISLQQMRNEINNDGDCAEMPADFNNTAPVIAPKPIVHHIPKATPFALTMTASDQENNSLTYTWEQMDKEIAPQPPLPTNEAGPSFRSLSPSESATRYFPNLNDLVKNIAPRWEVLPSVARTMNFRGTVRDNYIVGGCTEELDIQIEVENGVPFEVITPNNKIIWEAGTQKEVNWTVGATNRMPINTQEVTILLSIDGGFTYPTVLAEQVPNTGNTTVLVPNLVTSQARIMVRAFDNIFFDISNEDFEITKPTDDFEVMVAAQQEVCVPNMAIFDIQIGETGNFTAPIDLSLSGLPNGITAIFSNETTVAPSTVSLSLSNFAEISGKTEFTLIAKSGNSEKTRTLSVIVSNGLPIQPVLLTPLANAGNVALKPILEWTSNPEVLRYQLELSTDVEFIASNTSTHLVNNNTFELPTNLNNATKYFWRVRGENACGVGAYSDIFTFETANEICGTFAPNDLPKNIPSLFRSTVPSEITITDKGKLIDLRIKNLRVSHTFIGDLDIELESPNGTVIQLVSKVCSADRNLELSFDDTASNTYEEIPCPPTSDDSFQSFSKLSAFKGEEIQGIWQLRVIDTELLDGGDFEHWEMEICYQKEKSLGLVSNKEMVSCFGEADGQLSVVPEGGTGNYQYAWSTGDSTATVSGLSAGTYTVTIFDGESSMDTTLMIEEPAALNITTSIVQDGCIGLNNGQIAAQISGGIEPYNFQWSNGAVSTNLTSLNSGNYELTITDGIGCTKVASQEILVYPSVEFSISSVENPSCPEDSTGSIVLNVLSDNLVFSWPNGLIGANQSNLSIGTYMVTATDENGCTSVEEVAISSVPDTTKPVLNLANPIVYLDEDGMANITAADFDNGSFDNCGTVDLQVSQNSFSCQNIGSQSLFIEGTDASGNNTLAELSIQIMDTFPPVFECLEELFINDCQALTESDYPTATDNCGNVEVALLQASDGGFSSNPEILSFQAIDRNGNESYCYVSFRQENSLAADVRVIDPACTGENSGSATVTAINGQAPYTYQWSDGNNQTAALATDLTSGSYEVTITDNSGCQIIEEVNVLEPFPIGLLDTEITDEINGGANGSIRINPLGGTGDLTISWFKADSLIGNDLVLENLSAGEYEVQISDERNCLFTKKMTVGLLTNTTDFSFVENINLYPNPTDGLLNLTIDLSTPQPFSITVYNLLGEAIILPFENQPTKSAYQLDLSTFENGVYFVQLSFEEGILSKKIMVLK